MAQSTQYQVPPEDFSVGEETASTAPSSVFDEDHLRSVKDYRTVRDLKLALTCGSFPDEQKKREKRGEPLVLLQDHSQDSSIPDLQRSSDDDMYDDSDDCCNFSDLEEELSKELDPEFDWVVQDLDKNSSVDQTLEDELYRLRVLRSYFILDNKPEVCFDRLTTLGSRLLNVPICIVSLVDLGRIWFVSSFGAGDARQIPRNMTFCAHANLTTQDLLIVKDASKDVRFKDNSLVSQPPHIRFYGGAPLICPEGVKLGTFCVLDTVPRPNGLSSEERHSLRELASMTVEMMVERRANLKQTSEDKSKLIACTAHDLLTPLSGVQMSVSLLKEDERLSVLMDDEQKEVLETAENCSNVLAKICHETIETFRAEHNGDTKEIKKITKASEKKEKPSSKLKPGYKIINIEEMINNVSTVMDPYPKNVPLYVTVDPKLPRNFVSNELKVFRSLINYLTNACKHTEEGCIHLKLSLEQTLSGRRKSQIIFRVEDTGNGVPPETYPNLFRPFRGQKGNNAKESERSTCLDSKHGAAICGPGALDETPGLGLFSVANNIGSLNGDYGFRPRSMKRGSVSVSDPNGNTDGNGSIFWFSVPLINDPSGQSMEEPATNNMISKVNTQRISKPGGVLIKGKSSSSAQIQRRKLIVCDELPVPTTVKTKKHHKKASKTEVVKIAKRLGGGTWNRKKTAIIVDSEDDTTVESDEIGFPELDSVVVPMVKHNKEPKSSKKKPTKNVSLIRHVEPDMKSIDQNTKFVETHMEDFVISQESKVPERKPKVLIIDDSLVIRKSVARAFTVTGYEVVNACNGLEGLEKLKGALFDLVLCDFLMPVMDGLDCVQQYREWECKHRPWFSQYIMGISAHANEADMKRGLEVGMNDFHSKPLPLNVIKNLAASEEIREVGKILDKLANKAHVDLSELKRINGNSHIAKPPLKISPSFASSFKMPAPIGLVVAGEACERTLTEPMLGLGWQVVIARDLDHAVKELKQRNFDIVLVDDSQHAVVEMFRDWENASRITKQRNVVFLCRRYMAPPSGATVFKSSMKPYPSGFDDILAKPVQSVDLTALLQRVKNERLCETSSKDIMLR